MDVAVWSTPSARPPAPRRSSLSASEPPGEEPSAAAHVLAIAAHGDRAAFTLLFIRFAPRIKAFLGRRGAGTAAEELTQEVMLNIWRKAAYFDPARGTAEAWMFTIARNAAIDAARKRRGAPTIDLDPMYDAPEPMRGDVVLLAAQDARRVRAAIGGLSSEQLEIVRLSFFDDRPHVEIAELLGLPLGTVKSRLRLAMKRLRKLLEGAI